MAAEKSKVKQEFLALDEEHDATKIGVESCSIYGLAVLYFLRGLGVATRPFNKQRVR